MMMMMQISFAFSTKIFFDSWNTNKNLPMFLLVCLLIFLFGVLCQLVSGVKILTIDALGTKGSTQTKNTNPESFNLGEGSLPPKQPEQPLIEEQAKECHSKSRFLNKMQIFYSIFFFLVLQFFGVMNMFVLMTYNGWVILALIFGHFLGFLVFNGSNPQTLLKMRMRLSEDHNH